MHETWAPHAAWILALLATATLAIRLAFVLAAGGKKARRRAPRTLAAEESATAVLEFALVLPIFMMVVLIVIQLALLVQARLVVGYAAYTSCRTAIVWLSEGFSVAGQRAACSAELALMTISPAESGGAGGLDRQLAPLFAHGGPRAPARGRLARAGAKVGYADRETRVSILCPVALGPHTPVTSRVEHRFRLGVPYAGGLLAKVLGSGGAGEPSITIADSYTLLHEGRVDYQRLQNQRRTPSASFAGSLLGGGAWR